MVVKVLKSTKQKRKNRKDCINPVYADVYNKTVNFEYQNHRSMRWFFIKP